MSAPIPTTACRSSSLEKYLRFDRRDLQAYIDAKRAESRRQPRRR
jgi:hypothetical protein